MSQQKKIDLPDLHPIRAALLEGFKEEAQEFLSFSLEALTVNAVNDSWKDRMDQYEEEIDKRLHKDIPLSLPGWSIREKPLSECQLEGAYSAILGLREIITILQAPPTEQDQLTYDYFIDELWRSSEGDARFHVVVRFVQTIGLMNFPLDDLARLLEARGEDALADLLSPEERKALIELPKIWELQEQMGKLHIQQAAKKPTLTKAVRHLFVKLRQQLARTAWSEPEDSQTILTELFEELSMVVPKVSCEDGVPQGTLVIGDCLIAGELVGADAQLPWLRGELVLLFPGKDTPTSPLDIQLRVRVTQLVPVPLGEWDDGLGIPSKALSGETIDASTEALVTLLRTLYILQGWVQDGHRTGFFQPPSN
jgi:hypothetical protein